MAKASRDRLILLFGLVAVFAASLVLPHTPLMETSVCVIKLATGYSCPGCGLGRSFVAMSAGDPAAAWHAHALGPAIYVLALIWLLRTAWMLRSPRP